MYFPDILRQDVAAGEESDFQTFRMWNELILYYKLYYLGTTR